MSIYADRLRVGTLTADAVAPPSTTVGIAAGTESAVLLTLEIGANTACLFEVGLVGTPWPPPAQGPAVVCSHKLLIAATRAGAAAVVDSVAAVQIGGAGTTTAGYPVVAAAGAAIEVRISGGVYGHTQAGSRWSGRATALNV